MWNERRRLQQTSGRIRVTALRAHVGLTKINNAQGYTRTMEPNEEAADRSAPQKKNNQKPKTEKKGESSALGKGNFREGGEGGE